ncbi:ABC transporter permease subunit [Paenibacillus thiaminolyticus]|uniref:ABC transporter permease subunit n=1 Tax=Paenibacillus thiaminolyticus TaxID=49283 RepID=A0AAJ1LH25_PANTH|nr:ABC transporter permease subunit [Paenibacillus thiaminolyticus]MCY9533818.1 ABC transporter permease subunit [Paenibacillus thiaminolyticus]MCY9604377.1 ABC transporter permease subunit [Paenibacillus thiaminolyticus]MCY9609827.1 ABC transporter permease subunit [Paenibacillus thiaminolyticus]MCY9613771.1 ABC transporter permease subunit [Paenibacillus thiaminolyticus]MCY9620673.1 ABC transporter permease subunit [Paenibacillus thiaminolyticus]
MNQLSRMWKREWPLHIMLIPGLIFVILFSYIPMAGILMAFQKYIPTKGLFGSPFVGWKNFQFLLDYPDIGRIVFNTLYIATMKIIAGLIVPITIAILLNELRKEWVKRAFQTMVYLPHFLSWVLLSGIVIDVLSPSTGILNQLLGLFGVKPIFFLGDNSWFPYVMVITDVWKEFGFGTIIYLAALTNINPALYEAAEIDGAGRWKQTLYVTLPGMMPIIVLMLTLNIGNVLNAGFDQIFNLYSPQVYESGDIIDTFVYRMGIEQAQYGFATAVGLLKSVVSFILISVSYVLAYRFANYRIF